LAKHGRDEDLQGHPDHAENERALFSRFCAVREHYDIAPGGVLIGWGARRWYAPIAHPELPQFVAKLAEADDRGILAFANTYGELGFTSLTRDPKAAFYTWPDGSETMGGDPLDWMRAHGRTVQLCLELTEALRKNSTQDIDRLLHRRPANDRPTFIFLPVAKLAEIDTLQVELVEDAFARARAVRATVINPNIAHVHRALRMNLDGADQSLFVYRATIEAVYWHLANAAEGGIVARCKRPGCGALFIRRHRSQEYCAPRWNQRESPCALWVRQQRMTPPGRRETDRASASEAGALSARSHHNGITTGGFEKGKSSRIVTDAVQRLNKNIKKLPRSVKSRQKTQS
jgi:hypothetical protein